MPCVCGWTQSYTEPAHSRPHLQFQLDRINAFDKRYGLQTTDYQRLVSGKWQWVPCRWRDLCKIARQIYTEWLEAL